MLGILIYFNYSHLFQNNYTAAPATGAAVFFGYYFLYLLPYAGAFFLQLLFYKQLSYYKSKWFWTILLLAPALFAIKVNFNWQHSWIINHFTGASQAFYLKCINSLVKAAVLLLLLYVFWLLKDKNIQPFYGWQKTGSLKPYWMMVLIMLPLILVAGTQSDFLKVYPKAAFIHKLPLNFWWDKGRYILFELCYGFDFLSIEFFFRGFLILALLQICGTHCIIPAACFYCAIHLGKPMAEAISSIFGGLLLGIIVYNTKSIRGGLLVHVGIAWLMEICGWLMPLLQ